MMPVHGNVCYYFYEGTIGSPNWDCFSGQDSAEQ